MSKIYRCEYSHPPSALKYMLFALLPKKGFKNTGNLPEIVAIWKNCKPSSSSVKAFAKFTGLQCDTAYHPLFLHTISFRLIMSVLTHPAFPEAIWNVLQVRNVIIQRRALYLDGPFDLKAKIANHRILQKGLEVDIQASISVSNDVVWESTSTIFIRGNFGPSSIVSTPNVPEKPSLSHSTWNFFKDGGRAFASLTGDYNGIHMWDWYAKMFGFKAAFSHPQRVVGQLIKRLLAESVINTPLKIEIWLKGPVYYGASLELMASEKENDTLFSLHVNGDHRSAIIGRYSRRVT